MRWRNRTVTALLPTIGSHGDAMRYSANKEPSQDKCSMIWLKTKVAQLLHWSRSGQEISTGLMRMGLVCCVLVALGLRLLTLYAEPVISRDGVNYIQLALNIQGQKTDHETAFAPAMATAHYFYATYLSSHLFSLDPHQLGVSTNIVLGTLLPLLFFGIAHLLWGKNELSLACAALAAVYPDLVAYSIEVQREIPYIFFAGCFFLSGILLFRHKRWYWSAAMGATVALSFVCRYEGAELFLFALIPFCIMLLEKQAQRPRIILYFGTYIIFTVLTLGMLLILIDFSPMDFCHAAYLKAAGYMEKF